MASRNYVKKSVIRRSLQNTIASFQSGPRLIQGTLSVMPGHDYWWFLEYGTGIHFETPQRELKRPDAVSGKSPEGGAYEIEAKGEFDEPLVYISMFHGHPQRMRRLGAALHPGIKPIAIVRTAIFRANLYLEEDLKFLAKRKKLPTREEIVKMLNYIFDVLHGDVQLLTPDDSDPDPYHDDHRPHTPPLSEAWLIKKAK